MRKHILLLATYLITSFTAVLMAAEPLLKEAINGVEIIFCVDGGGSKTSLEVINKKLQVLEIEKEGKEDRVFLTGSTNINIVGWEDTRSTLDSLLNGIRIGTEKLALSEIKENAAIVCGLAGLSSNADKIPAIREIFTSLGFQNSHIFLSSDIDLAKQLIKEEEGGAILISGTGSICFSKSPQGEKRVGGYGYALGDEGSGFYVGKLASDMAFREEFEKDETFVLTPRIRELFKLPEASKTSDVIKLFYNHTLKPADIAKICPLVFEQAYQHHDECCLKIIDKCAGKLAKLVKRTVKGLTLPNFPIYLQGGVFKNENASDFIERINAKSNYEYGLQFINISKANIASLVIKNVKQ